MKFNISKIIVFLFLLTLKVNAFATVYTLGTDDFIIDVPSPTIKYSLGFSTMSEPSTPAAGDGYLYFKSDKKLYLKDDAGLETIVSVSTAGIAASIAALESSTSTLEGYIFDLWTSTSNLEGRVDALEVSTSTLETSIVNLETSTSTLEGYIFTLWNSTSTLETAIALNTTHRSSDGSDHTFINQDVTDTGTPTFLKIIVSTINAPSGTDHILVSTRVVVIGGYVHIGDGGTKEPGMGQEGDLYVKNSFECDGTSYLAGANVRAQTPGLRLKDQIELLIGTSSDYSLAFDVGEDTARMVKGADITVDANLLFSWNKNSAVMKSSTTVGLQGTTPLDIGEFYLNTDTNEIWVATGTAVNQFTHK